MPPPIDYATNIKFALEGRIVTMDENDTVLDRGVVYVDAGIIAEVKPEGASPPPGFENIELIRSRGTIYPGMIELHNHLPYNVLPLWQVPKLFQRREQWRNHEDKRRLVTAPMRVLGETEGYIQAVVRYVECKCLVSGVTTSQGITLFSAAGSQRYYRGIVRNVENTDDQLLPEAKTKVSDVEAQSVEKFFERLKSSSCMLLHLSEGIDEIARKHFLHLQLPSLEWAISPALAGIHSLGLSPEDIHIHGQHGGTVVWSPLSNMLLYGRTLDLASAKAAGVRMGLGSDWSPSGSKNLLGELKIARLVSQAQGGIYSDRELLAMVTRNAADMLGWKTSLGSIEKGKFADLVVVYGRRGDPYAQLIEQPETRVSLVVIHGVPRCGWPSLMSTFGLGTEDIRIGYAQRRLNLEQETADPLVAGLSLGEAENRLRQGLSQVRELARQREARILFRDTGIRTRGVSLTPEPDWNILLDNDEPQELRGYLGLPPSGIGLSTPRGPQRTRAATAGTISRDLESAQIELDELTVADDPNFLERISRQQNLPDFVKTGLPDFY
jgi:5-methylthioadenosine/S-adenosylhomocysteine deaminase